MGLREPVGALMRHVSSTVVAPRFRRLGPADVLEKSAGEIVTILAERSDHYGDVALVWSALVAFAALTVTDTVSCWQSAIWLAMKRLQIMR